MMMEHFTVNLVSNTSLNEFPDNKLSSFKTLLPDQGLDLNGTWEVALSEISYPGTLKNIIKGEFLFTSNIKEGSDSWLFYLPDGHYADVGQIMLIMYNMVLERWDEANLSEDDAENKRPEWSWNVNIVTKKLHLKLGNEDCVLEMRGILLDVLGFNQNDAYKRGMRTRNSYRSFMHDNRRIEEFIVSEFPVDLQRVHVMFVYTNIITPQIVGNVKAPLLRALSLVSSSNSSAEADRPIQISERFTLLEPKRLICNTVDIIELKVCGEDGKPIPFPDVGRVTATLIFRKISDEIISISL